jgi:pyruvate dehydrogenase E2 component (dihydrolipoamide acetyltransferase)
MSSFVFHLPDIGEGVVEGEVVKVLVKEGDRVEEDQILAEVMTDKAAVQIPSPKRGIIEKVHISAGQVVPVEAPMFTIGLAATRVPTPAFVAQARVDHSDEMPTMSVLPAIVVPNDLKASSSSPASREDALRVLATPTTRRIARELGVDLTKLSGSGKDGRVTKEDVERAGQAPVAKTPSTLPATPIARALHTPPNKHIPEPRPQITSPVLEVPLSAKVKPQSEARPDEERMPLRGLRKTIAQNMVRSKFTAPHYTYVEEVDVTALTELRNRTKHLAEDRGIKLSFLPFIVKSAVAGLKQFPLVNASLDDESNEIILKKYYHIGIAVSTDQGLMTIVIRDADKKSLFQIAKEIEDLSAKAREGKASRDELLGSTFTITSLGKLGGVLATPILNYPEVAIMGVHKISKKPVVKNDQIVIGETMNISHSFDHRVVDGAIGASFVAYMIKYLENPDLLLLEGV